MKWLRRVLIRLRPEPAIGQSLELARTRPQFEATLRKADRVIAEYRKYDGLLRVTVKR